jgi:hypothetical protein
MSSDFNWVGVIDLDRLDRRQISAREELGGSERVLGRRSGLIHAQPPGLMEADCGWIEANFSRGEIWRLRGAGAAS